MGDVVGRSPEGPTVSVIIPVRDDLAGLRRCLTALGEQSFPRARTEVIVVDNGSRRPIGPAVADFPWVRSIVEPRGGSYAARNAGLALARGEVLAFTDADCVPASDWLSEGVAFLLDDPGCGLAAGRIDVTVGERPSLAGWYELVTAFPQEQYATIDRFAATANAWVPRTVIERIGGFDEGLTSGGDAEFGTRVHAAGFRVRYADRVRVAHPARTMRELLRKQRRVGAGLRDRHALQPPSRTKLLRLVATRLLPYVAAARIARRPGPPADPSTRLRIFALALAVRQLYGWSYLATRPRIRPEHRPAGDLAAGATREDGSRVSGLPPGGPAGDVPPG